MGVSNLVHGNLVSGVEKGAYTMGKTKKGTCTGGSQRDKEVHIGGWRGVNREKKEGFTGRVERAMESSSLEGRGMGEKQGHPPHPKKWKQKTLPCGTWCPREYFKWSPNYAYYLLFRLNYVKSIFTFIKAFVLINMTKSFSSIDSFFGSLRSRLSNLSSTLFTSQISLRHINNNICMYKFVGSI